uniref:Armadillo repeat containing 3 n=1 Tax=Latimeria chalumnae TaxID=7897 RepID=H3A300_LATCH
MGKKVKKEAEPPPQDVFDPLSVESKKAATVVLMLQSPEEEVLAKACEALYKFAEKGDENKGALLGFGAVASLAKLISHEEKTVRRNATMAFGVMAAHSDVRKQMRKLDVIPSVIARLAPEEDVVIHEFASLCLAYMSVEYANKVKIFEQDGLEPLIQLLSSPDPDVKKNSVECIYNLVQDFQSRAAVRELNGIPPLLGLLKSEYSIIQQLALKTLITITNDTEARVAFRENQGPGQMIALLEIKNNNNNKKPVLKIVDNHIKESSPITMIRKEMAGALQQLGSWVKKRSQEEHARAYRTLCSIGYHPSEIRKLLHEQEVEKTLITLLAVDNDGVKTAASQAVAVMCENLASKDVLRKQGIPLLVQLLNSANEEVKEAAALALANLTNASPINACAVFEAEGVEPLINLLTAKRDGAIANAATVLTNMATQEAVRSSIQSHGIMHVIVEPLRSSNSVVLSKIALTVASVACDAGARSEFMNAGGLELLVKLLLSNNEDVRRNACWAVFVCASDEPTATELCRLSALDILQEINMSVSRKNYFSKATLIKLLDNNLSYKYSFLGYLSASDITSDGFYDLGQVKVIESKQKK